MFCYSFLFLFSIRLEQCFLYHQLLLKWVDKIVPSINQIHVKVNISRFQVYVCVYIFAYADPCIIVYTYVKTISTVTKISFIIYITFLHSYSSVQRIKTLEKQNLGNYARRCQTCMVPIIWHYRKGKTIAKKKQTRGSGVCGWGVKFKCKGIQNYSLGWWMCSKPWLWWKLQDFIYLPKLIDFIHKMCVLQYITYTSIKLF